MGTTSEWLQALLWGGLWGGGMAWWSSRKVVPAILRRPRGRLLHVALWGLAGLLFGILTTFHWQRAVHRPLVFVSVAAVAGMFLTGWLFRNESLRGPIPSGSMSVIAC
jgi:hypothetical protein